MSRAIARPGLVRAGPVFGQSRRRPAPDPRRSAPTMKVVGSPVVRTRSAVEPQVVFDGVTFRYPGAATPALEGVNFTMGSGEFILVAGPSASGKSTLLRCLNGLVPHF